MVHPKHIDKQTADGTAQNLDALYQLFPSCFTEMEDVEGKVKRAINWGKLRELLGDNVADGEPEVYDFTWVGKRAAQREAMAPIRKTLRPCPEESVNWDTTENLYIEGDNLEVLKLLLNSYMGKVKMIYIDPPYNTGNDFVYHDDFDEDYEEYDEHNKFEDGTRFWRNTDSNGRFHSDWCSMIYSRLIVARSFLTDDGVIFISIDDNEIRNLKNICDEIYGEANFVACFKWNRVAKAPSLSGMVRTKYEYVLAYHKGIQPKLFGKASYNTQGPLWHLPNKRAELFFPPNSIRVPHSFEAGDYGGTYQVELLDPIIEKNGINENEVRIIACSAWGQSKINSYINEGKTFQIKKSPVTVYTDLDSENNFIAPSDLIDDNECGVKRNTDAKEELRKMGIPFDYSKPTSLPEYLSKTITYTEKDSIIMDFFSGSATSAHAVMHLNADDGGNRKFIMVQWPEECDADSEAYKAGYKNICEIGKERIRRAGKKIKEEHPEAKDLDIGFRVFKCDESNYKNVAFTPKDYSQESLELFVDNIKEDRSDLDLLFDCMLRWGITLDLPMTSTKVDGCNIHNVNEGALVACFEGRVTEKVIDTICNMEPNKVVFRDSSFEEAAQKMNLFELFKQKLGWEEQEVRNNIRVI